MEKLCSWLFGLSYLMLVMIVLKAMIIGSEFSFAHMIKYGKEYWKWYKKRPEFVPNVKTVCECKQLLSQKEMKHNSEIARDTGRNLNMCWMCWANYCHHAVTGE
jgi:hypothetical protein